MSKNFEDLRPEDLIAIRKATEQEPPVVGAKYVPVKLSSMGKLGLPAVIHVRDYSYSDALKLASASTTTEIIRALTEVIDSITEEEIELDKLTNQDVLEILMTIQGTWYSPIMEFPYFIDETLPREELNKKENISKATIRINSVQTNPFPENGRVPFEVKMKDFSAIMDIPRFYNEVVVEQYIEQKYAELDNKMELLSKKIKEDTNTLDEYKSYMEYRDKRLSDTIKATQAIQILSINGRELKTLKERVEAMEEFPLRAWSKVNKHVQEDLNFGVNPEVRFNCTVTGKMITRRFPFRIMDFLPTVESILNAGDDISIC